MNLSAALRALLLLAPFAFAALPAARGETVIPLVNPGFEEDDKGWTWGKDDTMSEVTALAAHDGSKGLRVTDTSDVAGAYVASARFPAKPAEVYKISFWGRTLSGDGMAVIVLFADADHKELNTWDLKNMNVRTIPKDQADWKELQATFTAPERTATVQIILRSWNGAVVTADVDDFKLVRVSP